MYVCMYVLCVYIYIYIEREREREFGFIVCLSHSYAVLCRSNEV
jgi:hypothetical protein